MQVRSVWSRNDVWGAALGMPSTGAEPNDGGGGASESTPLIKAGSCDNRRAQPLNESGKIQRESGAWQCRRGTSIQSRLC